MKQVKVNYIEYKNWKGQSRRIDFNTDRAIIKGMNGTGKSTVYHAFLWLLLGVDEYDRTNYELFNNKIEHNKENSVPAIVEAEIEVDGETIKLKRTAEIGWVLDRKTSEYVRKGSDAYTYAIDDIERSATEFKKFVEETFAPADKLKLCLNVNYFLSLDWKERRKKLGDMVGEIKNTDFKGDYDIISSDLKKYSVEELKSKYKALLKPIDKKTESLPDAIKVMEENLPDISDLDEIKNNITDTKKRIEEIESNLMGYADINKSKTSELRDLQQKMFNESQKYEKEYSDKLSIEMTKLREVEAKNRGIEVENKRTNESIEENKKALERCNTHIASLNAGREYLLKEAKKVKAMKFEDEKCPYCGQELPEHLLLAAEEKFNTNKAKQYESIVERGKAVKEELEDYKKKVKAFEKFLETVSGDQPMASTKDAEEKIAKLKAAHKPFEETSTCKKLAKEIENLKVELASNESKDSMKLKEEKIELNRRLEVLTKESGKENEYDRQKESIKRLREDLRENLSEKVRLMGMLAKVSEYEREKAQIISDRVNGKFDYVRIAMTEVNKSGDIVDCCNIFDGQGVNVFTANTASNWVSKIDIANAFRKHYGINLPLFLDDANLINECNLPQLDCQTILLIVSDDKTLTLEEE